MTVPLLSPWPQCRCGSRLLDWLDWLPSRLMPGAQCSAVIRYAADMFVLLVSATSQKNKQTVPMRLSSRLKIFTCSPGFSSLKVFGIQKISVFQSFPLGLLYGEGTLFLSSHSCILTVLLPPQSNAFLTTASDIKEIFFGEPSHPLQNSQILKKKMVQTNWNITVGKVITT
ncbi:hypothetical protein PAMP_016973 [Pampus punctatissimus]